MIYTTYEPHYLEEHDRDESLISTEIRPAPVPSAEALKKRRQRLKKRRDYSDLIENWLDQFFGEFEHELTIRETLPVLSKYPKIVGEIALHVRGAV